MRARLHRWHCGPEGKRGPWLGTTSLVALILGLTRAGCYGSKCQWMFGWSCRPWPRSRCDWLPPYGYCKSMGGSNWTVLVLTVVGQSWFETLSESMVDEFSKPLIRMAGEVWLPASEGDRSDSCGVTCLLTPEPVSRLYIYIWSLDEVTAPPQRQSW